MNDSINQIRTQLKTHHHETPILFFKTEVGSYGEHDQFLGIKVPSLRAIAKSFTNLDLQDNQVLMQSPYNEERLLALIILIQQYQKANEEQKQILINYYLEQLKFVNNWNLVDASAHHLLGAHCFKHGKQPIEDLSKSNLLWEKRIAMVATLYFIKQGQLDLTYQIAHSYLDDEEDLIHKASGWMLREAGKIDKLSLKTFLNQYAIHMPRTMLRYAIEKLEQSEKTFYLHQKKPR